MCVRWRKREKPREADRERENGREKSGKRGRGNEKEIVREEENLTVSLRMKEIVFV